MFGKYVVLVRVAAPGVRGSIFFICVALCVPCTSTVDVARARSFLFEEVVVVIEGSSLGALVSDSCRARCALCTSACPARLSLTWYAFLSVFSRRFGIGSCCVLSVGVQARGGAGFMGSSRTLPSDRVNDPRDFPTGFVRSLVRG